MIEPVDYPAYEQYARQYPPPVAYPGASPPLPAPSSKRSRWSGVVVGIAVALTLFVVALIAAAALRTVVEPSTSGSSAVSTIAPVKTERQLVKEWFAPAQYSFVEMQDGMQAVADASSAVPVSIADLHSACAQVEITAQQFRTFLPSPNAVLTEELDQAMRQYVNSGQACQHLTLYSTESDVAVVAAFLTKGNEHMATANAIISTLKG